SNSHITTEEKKLISTGDVDIVTEPKHFDVVSKSMFTVSESGEQSETREEVTEDNFTHRRFSSP
ncbi:hypothetical protein A2U01_0072071, partial [Trifolium medium]|nr:hypothetical protein [Trifolium medium]